MTTYTSLSGATLREAAAKGDAKAQAEIDRRVAKREASGKWTVAALRAHGKSAEADTRVAAAQKAVKTGMKKAKAAVAKAISAPPAAAPAFTRTVETIKPARQTLKATNTRIDAIEQSVLSLARTQASMHEAVTLIAKKLGVEGL